MKLSRIVLSSFLALVAAGCGALGGNQPTGGTSAASMPSVDIGALLGGITDQSSAEKAKSPLETAVTQLKTALGAAETQAKVEQTAGTTDAAGARSMLDGVLAKFGLGADTADQITALLQNEQVKAVLGSTLEQLKGLLPTGS